MKYHFFVFSLLALFLTACATNQPPLTASHRAVMHIRVGREKMERQVVIALREDAAPQTTANFKELVSRRYYNGLPFHRVFPHSLVQTGDPKSRHGETPQSGTGGPGYTIPAEIRLPHQRGAVAAARLPDTINPQRASNGSQFYICLESMPQLNGQYTVFGQVTEGFEVLDAISTLPTDYNNFPIEKVVITSITLTP